MFEWFYHLLRLKSPREMREIDAQFRKDMRKSNMELARAIVEDGLTGERREKALARITEAERQEA